MWYVFDYRETSGYVLRTRFKSLAKLAVYTIGRKKYWDYDCQVNCVEWLGIGD